MAILVSRYKRVYGVKGQLTSDIIGGGELGQSTIWADVATFGELPNENLRNGDLCTVTADNYTYRYNDDINTWEISIVRESDRNNFPTLNLYEFAIGYVVINGDEEYLNPYFFDFDKDTWIRYITDSSVGWNTDNDDFYTDFTNLPDSSDGAEQNDTVLVNPGDGNLYYLTMYDGFIWNLNIGYFNTFSEMDGYPEPTVAEVSRAYIVNDLDSSAAGKIPYIRNSINDGWDRVPYNVSYYYYDNPVTSYSDLSNDLVALSNFDLRLVEDNLNNNYVKLFSYNSEIEPPQWESLIDIYFNFISFDPADTEYAGFLSAIYFSLDDISSAWSYDIIVGSYIKGGPNVTDWKRSFLGIPFIWNNLPNITDLDNINANAGGWILDNDEIKILDLGYSNSYGTVKVNGSLGTYDLIFAYFDTVDDMNSFITDEMDTYNISLTSETIIQVGS